MFCLFVRNVAVFEDSLRVIHFAPKSFCLLASILMPLNVTVTPQWAMYFLIWYLCSYYGVVLITIVAYVAVGLFVNVHVCTYVVSRW